MASTSSAYDSESKIHPILGAGDADTTTEAIFIKLFSCCKSKSTRMNLITEEISRSVEEVSPLNCVTKIFLGPQNEF